MKKTKYLWITILFLLGLGLITIPNGMRFTGFLLLWTAALWVVWLALTRWTKRSKTGRWCRRIYSGGLAAVLAVLCAFETAIVFRGEADNSAIPVDAVIVLGAGVNGETPSAALWSRIRAAEDYLKKHPDVPVVLTGGPGTAD